MVQKIDEKFVPSRGKNKNKKQDLAPTPLIYQFLFIVKQQFFWDEQKQKEKTLIGSCIRLEAGK